MNFTFYEQDQGFVIAQLKNGEFDYIDSADEVAECEFFRTISADRVLQKLADTYPNPRTKSEVEIWIYIASNLSMRFHGVHAFNAFPYVIRAGGMINAFGAALGRKTSHPETGDTTLRCEGFNNKNSYDRQTPCDPDYLRKLARDTDAQRLIRWYNTDVVRILKEQHAFDKDGIFIGDASYLFVPDNPRYENSVKLLFGPDGYPVDYDQISEEQKQQCTWKRCYKFVSLLHVRKSRNFFVYGAVDILPGNAHECPAIFQLIDTFVESVGKGVIKRLIVDRGLMDGKNIARIKQKHGIDTLVPLKRNMQLYKEVLNNIESPDIPFQPYQQPNYKSPPPRPNQPKKIREREKKRQETIQQKKKQEPSPPPQKQLVKREIAAFKKLHSLESCSVPVNVVVNRDSYGDGSEKIWMLLDTAPVKDPAVQRNLYALRTQIEERHRQFKGFANLSRFTAQVFSLVTNHVVFTILAYSLLQIFLLIQKKRPELNSKTLPSIRRLILPTASHVIVYCQNRFAFMTPMELVQIILNLEGEARTRARMKTQIYMNQVSKLLRNPRPP